MSYAKSPEITDRAPKRVRLLLIASCVIAITIAAAWVIKRDGPPEGSVLTAATLPQITEFTPYYFAADIPGDFKLLPGSIAYSNGVLLFQLRHERDNRSIAVTQQLLPTELASTSYPKAKLVDGADGRAFIVYNGTQVTGSLFSNPQKGNQTLVLLNSADPVPEETIADLLRAFRPAHP